MRRIGDFENGILYSPDEGGADDTLPESDSLPGDDGGVDAGDAGDPSGDGTPQSDKPLSVREQLKASIAEVQQAEQGQPKPKVKREQKTGRFEQAAPPVEGQQPPVQATPAPESLSKEAKAEWDKAPPAIQQAFVKREQDMQRGVDELKQKYNLIDQAIAPHTDALRQMNATPGEAVNRMFLWFKALAGDPVQAFPGLAKSFGLDWNKVVAAIQGGQQPSQQQQQPAAAEIPEPIKNYVGQLEQRLQQAMQQIGQIDGRFNTIQQDVNAQNFAKTQENLTMWSTGKEFFEDVRQDMARFIESGLIPLKNGQVDLDTAYERAIHFNPDVRAKVLAKQQQANSEVQQASQQAATTARQTQVNKARKAAVSLPSTSAPGSANGAAPVRKPGQKTSVRDSLKEALAQLRDQ